MTFKPSVMPGSDSTSRRNVPVTHTTTSLNPGDRVTDAKRCAASSEVWNVGAMFALGFLQPLRRRDKIGVILTILLDSFLPISSSEIFALRACEDGTGDVVLVFVFHVK